MFNKNQTIASMDAELYQFIEAEGQRQETYIGLIASENYASPAVLEAQGSFLTNKYAEGYPGKRYYGGCLYVDQIEQLAIDRAKTLFGADYANVQPHSGSQANAAAYAALIEPGDVVLGMSLNEGGHLTHGSKVNFSGKIYQVAQYGIHPDTGLINFEQIACLAEQLSPKLIVAGFSAYSRKVDWGKFREIADRVGAYLIVDMAHVAGLVAAGLYPSPVSVADVVTSTTHKTLRGARGGLILAKANPEIEQKLNKAVFPGIQGGPLLHAIAAKAVAFKEAMDPAFKAYQTQVIQNAQAMAETMTDRGYEVVSGGTDNHLFLVSLIHKGITGKEAEAKLEAAHIILNKNAVPGDPQSPFVTSGLRLGTPSITTRGFGVEESKLTAGWICDILDDMQDEQVSKQVKQKVLKLCHQYPVYEK